MESFKMTDLIKLNVALEESNIEKLKLILTKENVNNSYIQFIWETPLFLAADLSNLEVIKYLHSINANLFYKNRVGESVIDWAIAAKHQDIEKVKYLMLEMNCFNVKWNQVPEKLKPALQEFTEMMLLKNKLEKDLNKSNNTNNFKI